MRVVCGIISSEKYNGFLCFFLSMFFLLILPLARILFIFTYISSYSIGKCLDFNRCLYCCWTFSFCFHPWLNFLFLNGVWLYGRVLSSRLLHLSRLPLLRCSGAWCVAVGIPRFVRYENVWLNLNDERRVYIIIVHHSVKMVHRAKYPKRTHTITDSFIHFNFIAIWIFFLFSHFLCFCCLKKIIFLAFGLKNRKTKEIWVVV